jgi:predicted transcriptional regulator
MSRAVMLSIRPKWVEKIANGEKTIEVRKTRPKLDTPFKVYIYCTMPDTKDPHQIMEIHGAGGKIRKANGKVIGEFVCDCVTPLYNVCMDDWKRLAGGLHNIEKELVNQACLTEAQLHTYAGGKNCFAWHISDLKIYDTPKELIEFHTWEKCKSCSKSEYESTACIYDENCMIPAAITKAPQSWCYVEEG